MLVDKVKNNFIFYLLIVLFSIGVCFSTPFLRYPYDMFYHLIIINDLYIQLVQQVNEIEKINLGHIYVISSVLGDEPILMKNPRFLWHYLWADLFYFLHIDSVQMFLRAKIIHVIQTFISLYALYYFSKVVLRNLFKDLYGSILQWLSLWSTIIWLTIFATFSATYHQVWILWYSVNYQITLSLFWYITALTLVLFLEETTWKIKFLYVFIILLISRFILQAHSMEFMYYLMYLLVFSAVFSDKIFYVLKKYLYLLIPLIGVVYYFITHFKPDHSKLFNYLNFEKISLLYSDIMREGAILLHGYNRASASMNELIIMSLAIGTFILLWFMVKKLNHKRDNTNVNFRMLLFVYITSLFVLIPVFQFTGGLFGIITKTMVVNRLYYSASLFLWIPIFMYYLVIEYKLKLRTMHLFIFGILFSVVVFSKHTDILHHNYYKNVKSIANSFDERKVGFNLSSKQIKEIESFLIESKEANKENRDFCYFAPADVAFVIKYMYKENAYWEGRRGNPDYKMHYEKCKLNNDCKCILFKIPKDFPSYRPYT